MIRRVKDIFMFQTAGELKKALNQIPDDTLLVRNVFKIKLASAHISLASRFFISFHNEVACPHCERYKDTSKIEQVLIID